MRTAWLDQLSPAGVVLLFVAVKGVLWALVAILTHLAVPLDVAEIYASGRTWAIATEKHPNLPGLMLEVTRLMLGATGWPAYVVSQACVALTFLAVFLLGREMLGPTRAAVGVLLLAGVAFYAWPTVEFNHNIAQMLIWALLALAAWRAVEFGSGRWWLALGTLAGLSLYAKLSGVLLLVAIGGWMAWDDKARDQLKRAGPWLAVAVFAMVSAPLVFWLAQNKAAPLAYAAERAAHNSLDQYFASLALNLGGFLAILGMAGLLRVVLRPDAAPVQTEQRAVTFLSIMTLAPLVLAIGFAIASRSGLKAAWSSSMFNLLGVLAVALAGQRVTSGHLARVAPAALALASLVPLGYAGVVLAGPTRNGVPMRVNWPQAEIAQRFVGLWQQETGQPLRVVGGSNWVAGLVAMDAPGAPAVVSRADGSVPPQILERDGVLLVWEVRPDRVQPPFVTPLIADRTVHSERFAVPRGRKVDDLVINYVIVPPSPEASGSWGQ